MKVLLKNNLLQNWSFLLILLLIPALLLSRAGLSLLSVLIIVPALFSLQHQETVYKFCKGAAGILLPVLISGIWSHDRHQWALEVLNKLPLITVSIGLIGAGLTPQKVKLFIFTLCFFVFGACIWSMVNYGVNASAINQSYLVAKVMPTLMDNDHIRFSWLIVISSVLLAGQLALQSSKKEKIGGLVLIVFFFVYLHFLAAKTGLLCMYGCLIISGCWSLLYSKEKKWAVWGFILVPAVVLLSYFAFPTLQHRVQYVVWDYQQYSHGIYRIGSSDGDRLLSYTAGWDIANAHPVFGCGFGDLLQEINNWHTQHHPQSQDYERFKPTNEWLIYAAASGWTGMLIFTAGILLLFLLIWEKELFSICLCLVLLIPLITDDTLGGQYGVFLLTAGICLGWYIRHPLRSKLL